MGGSRTDRDERLSLVEVVPPPPSGPPPPPPPPPPPSPPPTAGHPPRTPPCRSRLRRAHLCHSRNLCCPGWRASAQASRERVGADHYLDDARSLPDGSRPHEFERARASLSQQRQMTHAKRVRSGRSRLDRRYVKLDAEQACLIEDVGRRRARLLHV